MFKEGDLVTYSTHGICKIVDICTKTYSGITRNYYVLHPIGDSNLTIQCPTDNKQNVMQEMMDEGEAEEILESFKQPGMNWIEKPNDRKRYYSDMLKTGNRETIAKIVNTLMRKKRKVENDGKKLAEADRKMLCSIQNILFKELAFSLNTSFETIDKQVNKLIKLN